MENGGGESASGGGGKRGGTVLLVIVACAAALALGRLVYMKMSGGNGGTPAVNSPTVLATTQAEANSIAGKMSASSPASLPAVPDSWTPPKFTDRQKERGAMVDIIENYYNLDDQATLAAMRAVPRHEFVPADQLAHAYDDTPLPISNGQLISQPWIVAFMTSQLQLTPDSKVLEIGTGSGYQAAVLTQFTRKVFTIEIIKPLEEAAAARLGRLGYTPVQVRNDDGFNGWPEEAPFDAIIVTCAAGQIPPPLIKQLKNGGRMMIPVGGAFAMQSLMRVEKDEEGTVHSESLTPVRFVPLLAKDPTANEHAGK